MKTSSCKAKGRKAVQRLKEILIKASGFESDDFLIAGTSKTGEDLQLSPKARSLFPVTVEVKNQEKAKIWEWIKQAQGHAENTEFMPCVVFTRNREKLYFCCELESLLELLFK